VDRPPVTGPVVSYVDERGRPVPVSAQNPLPTTGSGMAPEDLTAKPPLAWDADTATLALQGRTLPEGGTTGQVVKVVDGAPAWAADANTTYTVLSQANAENASSTTAGLVTGQRLAQAIAAHRPVVAYVDPASETALADLVAALRAAGLMADPPG
jgi:hypothetical protein